jgi:hypothetical protein
LNWDVSNCVFDYFGKLSRKSGALAWFYDVQQHILGFATCLYNYILVKKDICD